MKKIFYLFALLLFLVSLVACIDVEDSNAADSTDDNENLNQDLTTEEEPVSDLGIGDTAEVGGIKFTLKNITTTDERNEFAETDPTMVIKIEYEIENNTEDEIPIGVDLEVYDGTENKMDSYPLENTMGSLQPGKKIQGTQHYGIEEGPIELYFQPMMSLEDPAIFKVDIE